MKLQSRALLACGLAAAAVAAGYFGYRSRSLSNAALLKRLPAADALVLYVDFDALRHGGVLQLFDGSKVGQDPEYKSFVGSTGFNYARDLDLAMVAFAPTGRYVLLRGRFDWPKLRAYAKSQQGSCSGEVCQMAGSTPERRISFLPLQSNVMAMGVSTDDFAAQRLASPATGPAPQMPASPVWLSLPHSILKAGEDLPEGTRMFAHSLDRAESVTLGFEPEGQRLAAKLNVLCRNEQDATEIASQLARITTLLRELIQREHQAPNPADLSGVLTAGAFRAEGRRVYGYWPIERKFVESILGGA
ncbi:MAG TPA: hypothetical protein VGS58_11255 [Candidatus Sulfopaludibacter sp.]|nr:hypothetical protein [Candidatus Sulfopaludibacter sp.]